MDVLAEVKAGHAQIEWAEVKSELDGHQLFIQVFRMPLRIGKVYPGVGAAKMQEIADLFDCMLMTPKVVDMLWLQAKTRIEPVIRVDGDITANTTYERYSAQLDKAILAAGGDNGGVISSVGKYWVLHNGLWGDHLTDKQKAALLYGKTTGCNYGWNASVALYIAVTKGLKVWQAAGFRHGDNQNDPSQTCVLMARMARLIRPDGSAEDVSLKELAKDPKLSYLFNHDGVLHVLRQPSVPDPGPQVPPPFSNYDKLAA